MLKKKKNNNKKVISIFRYISTQIAAPYLSPLVLLLDRERGARSAICTHITLIDVIISSLRRGPLSPPPYWPLSLKLCYYASTRMMTTSARCIKRKSHRTQARVYPIYINIDITLDCAGWLANRRISFVNYCARARFELICRSRERETKASKIIQYEF